MTPRTSDLDLLEVLEHRLEDVQLTRINGRIVQVVGLVAESRGPDVRVGDLCSIRYRNSDSSLSAEVVGFRGDRVLLMPLGNLKEIGPGCDVLSMERPLGVRVGQALLGRVLDGLGMPLDDRGPVISSDFYPLHAEPPHPLRRKMISSPLSVGVKVIDGVLTLGTGQRIGIFAGSGVGKSTLLAMMARYTEADVNVIALVGERGREVREFIDRDLGTEGCKRSVIVVATSDQPPLIRLKAALTATAVAEYFRDCGKNVLLMMDSVTRVARAQREVGLAVGEPPTTRGYTPSVFELLPRLLERAGAGERGNITGIYTVLVEGDDMNDGGGHGPRSAGRPRGAFAQDCREELLPLGGRAGEREPRDALHRGLRTPRGSRQASRAAGRLYRGGGPDKHRRLQERHQPQGRLVHRPPGEGPRLSQAASG